MPADRVRLNPISQPQPVQSTKTGSVDGEFANILNRELALKVSAHAETRMKSRNIALNARQWNRVQDGIDKAAAKGAKESLVLLDDMALIVSVKNRTVITAVDKESLRQNVFTNIDSAVIV